MQKISASIVKIAFMKKTKNILLFCFILFSFCSHAYAKNPVDDKRFSFELKEKTLSEALVLITQHTGFRFSYNPDIINGKEIVSLQAKEYSIDDILKHTLPYSVTYKQTGKHIIILPSTEKKEENNSLITSKKEEKLEKIPIPDTGILVDDCHSYVNLKNEEEMKKQLATLLLAATAMTTQLSAQDTTTIETIKPSTENNQESASSGVAKPFQFSFVCPLGTDWIHSPENTYNISLNLVGGVIGRSKGFELSSVFNMDQYSARGVQMAGVFNIAGYKPAYREESNVTQFASIFNYVKAGESTQFAGGVNIAEKAYVQAAGGINIAKESPAQIAGGINISKKGSAQLSGMANGSGESRMQMAGGINLTKQGAFQASGLSNIASTSACQIAGGVNVTKKGSFQLSGAVNVAETSSCQIAGGVNVTKRGGFQMGVINVRDTADGVTLGIINIVKHGGLVDFGVEGGEFLHTSLTFRSGTYKLYTIFSASYNYTDKFWSAGFGLGTSVSLAKWCGINFEFMHHSLYDIPSNWDEYNGLVQIRPLVDFRIAKNFNMFIGPTFNLLIQSKNHDEPFGIKVPYSIAGGSYDNTDLNFWIGVTGGIRF